MEHMRDRRTDLAQLGEDRRLGGGERLCLWAVASDRCRRRLVAEDHHHTLGGVLREALDVELRELLWIDEWLDRNGRIPRRASLADVALRNGKRRDGHGGSDEEALQC
jgi:hypothetical protein